MKFVRSLWRLSALFVLAACGNDLTVITPGIATYTIQVGSDEFAVRVADQATANKLNARMESGTVGVILGRVVAGSGGFNGPWSWHLDPSSIDVPDMSIELCDGTPSYLEAHRDEWIRDVKNYCPWGAKVIAVEQ